MKHKNTEYELKFAIAIIVIITILVTVQMFPDVIKNFIMDVFFS